VSYEMSNCYGTQPYRLVYSLRLEDNNEVLINIEPNSDMDKFRY